MKPERPRTNLEPKTLSMERRRRSLRFTMFNLKSVNKEARPKKADFYRYEPNKIGILRKIS